MNLKGVALAPDGCGKCSGSSSDNTIRAQAADLEPVTLTTATRDAGLVGSVA